MTNKILKATGFESRIRSKLGVDAAYIPDADINQPDIIAIAESNIIRVVPDYDALTGDDLIYLEAATVCECAILLCPSMPARLPVKEQGPSMTIELDVDWDAKQVKLEAERDRFLSNISSADYVNVPHFGLC
jgi:hypothetical protein